jgi:quercetin dioxygenase-like cupin family protein
MKNLNSKNRLKDLGRSTAFSRAFRAARRIATGVKGRQLALAAIVAAFSAVGVAAALTPAQLVSGVIFARASFADQTDIKFKIKSAGQEVVNVNNAGDTVMQKIIIAPGGNTGWHSHPGPVVVLVASGQMSFYDGEDPTCTARTYSAGQAFVDSGQGHVHIARNEGIVPLELYVTYFDVTPGVPAPGAFRIDAPSPGNCSF